MSRPWSSDPDAETFARLAPVWLEHETRVRRALRARIPQAELDDMMAELLVLLASPNHAEQAERVGMVRWAKVRVRDVQRRMAMQRYGYHRNEKRKRMLVESDLSDGDSPGLSREAPPGDPDTTADLLQMVDRLPPGPEREALVLHYLQHQEVGEIARHQGVTTTAVHNRLARARYLLRLGLDSYGP